MCQPQYSHWQQRKVHEEGNHKDIRNPALEKEWFFFWALLFKLYITWELSLLERQSFGPRLKPTRTDSLVKLVNSKQEMILIFQTSMVLFDPFLWASGGTCGLPMYPGAGLNSSIEMGKAQKSEF